MTKRLASLLAILMAFTLIAASCGDDDSGTNADPDTSTPDEPGTTTTPGEEPMVGGGTFIDGGTFVGSPPEHIDPHLNSTLDAYQVINAVYDGLTEIDASDPANPKVVPLVADEYSANDDASVWTFHIRDGQQFSNGDPITASTFQKSWERAADLAGDYSYLITFIDGGAERLAGEADTISGVVADDATNTLTVTLDAPYSNFDAVAGFQLFFPLPDAAIDAGADWENGIMIGNGPYAMESARTDQEISIVKSDTWAGDFNGETWPNRLDKIIFVTEADPDTAYNALEAGEVMNANIPPARVAQADADYGTTLDVNILGSYHFDVNFRDPRIGGDENLKLRQAISAAINRAEINTAVYNDSRTLSTGVTPPGIPGFAPDLCNYCVYNPEQAQTLFDEWVAEGGVQEGPIPIQFNADAGHEDVAAIIIDNLTTIGIQAEATPMPGETYFSGLADGDCVICRAGWFADYPTYDNFMFDLFHQSSLGGNNFGFVSDEFDALVDEAKQTVDKDAQAALFQEAETILLDEVGVIPINWYRGDYAYDETQVSNFQQTNFGLILWEQIELIG